MIRNYKNQNHEGEKPKKNQVHKHRCWLQYNMMLFIFFVCFANLRLQKIYCKIRFTSHNQLIIVIGRGLISKWWLGCAKNFIMRINVQLFLEGQKTWKYLPNLISNQSFKFLRPFQNVWTLQLILVEKWLSFDSNIQNIFQMIKAYF